MAEDLFSFSYHPPPDVISKAYSTLIKMLQWDKFTIFYEDEGSKSSNSIFSISRKKFETRRRDETLTLEKTLRRYLSNLFTSFSYGRQKGAKL